jgi:hypothetical protein
MTGSAATAVLRRTAVRSGFIATERAETALDRAGGFVAVALARKLGQFAGGPVEAQPPGLQRQHAVCQQLDVLGEVSAQHYQATVRDAAQSGPQVDAVLGVDTGGRLVQQQHPRLVDHGLREVGSLPGPA